jgi:hypothetical protein
VGQVEEHLLSKHETLSSNHSIIKKIYNPTWESHHQPYNGKQYLVGSIVKQVEEYFPSMNTFGGFFPIKAKLFS